MKPIEISIRENLTKIKTGKNKNNHAPNNGASEAWQKQQTNKNHQTHY